MIAGWSVSQFATDRAIGNNERLMTSIHHVRARCLNGDVPRVMHRADGLGAAVVVDRRSKAGFDQVDGTERRPTA